MDGMDEKGATSEIGMEHKNKEENFATFHFTKRFKMQVYKPLISMKAGYFLWLTASQSLMLYYYVYLKLQGMTITHIFWINTITSVATVLEIPLLAILVDKLGISAKTILVLNIMLSCSALFSVSFVRPLPFCEARGVYHCLNESVVFPKATCGATRMELRTSLCEFRCGQETCGEDCDTIDGFNATSVCFDFVQSFANHSKSSCEQGTTNDSSCSVSCPLVDPDSCERRRTLLIAVYSVLTCFLMMTYGNVFRFIDVTAMALLKEHSFDYGVIRFWGMLGTLSGPAVTGLVVHLATPDGEPANYKASFYLQTVLFLLTAAVCSRIDVRPLAPGVDLRRKIGTLVRVPDVLVFMSVLLTLGTTWAFNTLFKTWYLNDIGADAKVLSAVNTLMGLYGLPFLYNSEWIVKKVGNRRLIVLALLGHVVHSFGYSAVDNGWYCLILETTAVVTYHLLWISAIDITREIAPEGLLATVNSTAGNLHFNCGRITGSFFGGFLMKTYGGRVTYMIMGTINTVVAVLYVTYLYLHNRKRIR